MSKGKAGYHIYKTKKKKKRKEKNLTSHQSKQSMALTSNNLSCLRCFN